MNNPYTHLTIFERENIFLWSSQNVSVREIACRLNRSVSIISRELRRNSKDKAYSPIVAQAKHQKRKSRCGRKSIFSNLQSWKIVRHLFVDLQWSPEQIAARLKHEPHP
ncbi:transposase [Lactococcus garvieae]|uniref:transposase n=1 Tax=Lactococcus garvieae TaxID=1363 RepID=UPI00385197C8